MIGMFSKRENIERLARIDDRLQDERLSADEREELTQIAHEISRWLMDLQRIEGGGAE